MRRRRKRRRRMRSRKGRRRRRRRFEWVTCRVQEWDCWLRPGQAGFERRGKGPDHVGIALGVNV